MHTHEEFESVGDILKSIRFNRASLEQLMTVEFDLALSRRLDTAVLTEESSSDHKVDEQELTA